MESLKEKLINMGVAGVMGFIGGITRYCYYLLTTKDEKFSYGKFTLNLILATGITITIGEFLPEGFETREGILIACGISSHEIIRYLQEEGIKNILNKIKK